MTLKNGSGNRAKISKKSCVKNCSRLRGNLKSPKSPDFNRLRHRQKCPKISDLVYKFLGNVASINAERRQRNNARTNFQRTHVRRHSRRCRRPDDPKTTDKIRLQSGNREPKKYQTEFDLKKKSTTQFVEDYVKAVNESKQRAEKYIRKALSFGINAGFFLPTDTANGQVFRVSSALDIGTLDQNVDRCEESGKIHPEDRKKCSCFKKR